jgi:NADPH:quinone reductase-like Zn-dependent oxidoreductase
MQQLTFVGPHQLEWHDVAEPTIDSGEAVLVRPIAVASCDLDVGIIDGLAVFPGPFAFGHEFVADVVSVGAEVRDIAVGQPRCRAVPDQLRNLHPVHGWAGRELHHRAGSVVIWVGTAVA